MKTAKATRNSKTKSKARAHKPVAHKLKKIKLKAKAKRPMQKSVMAKKPVRTVNAALVKRLAPKPANVTPITDSNEYARRVFVRLDSENKELVRKVSASVGLSPYITHFAAEAARAGAKLVADPAIGKETGIFVRFESAAVKTMIGAMAKACNVSMSSYCAYFAVQAAKAGKKMPVAEKAAAAS